MGDYAPASITIYTCPDQATAHQVISILERWGFHPDPFIEGPKFTLGEELYAGETGLLVCEEAGAALHDLGVTFLIAQDAKYEYEGTVAMGVPGLDLFVGPGNGDGEPMLAAAAIEDLITEAGGDFDWDDVVADQDTAAEVLDRLVASLRAETGSAHSAAIAAAREALPAEPPTFTYDEEFEEAQEESLRESGQADAQAGRLDQALYDGQPSYKAGWDDGAAAIRKAEVAEAARHEELKAEWQAAFDALRAAGLEADADDPIAARYRATSDAVNHSHRKREGAAIRKLAPTTEEDA
jgi:hypothetical protein